MLPTIQIFEDVAALTEAAAQMIAEHAAEAISARGAFHIALSGGSTPRPVYARWAELPTDWSHVHIWFGDERCVPPEHTDSNYRMARETLLDHVGIPPTHIRRIEGELLPASRAAARINEMYQSLIEGGKTLDLVLLGLGDDAHTASLFPTTAALTVRSARFVENFVPKLGVWRITLTYPAINSARAVLFLVTGSSKADGVRRSVKGAEDITFIPAQGVQPRSGSLTWMLNAAAAGELDRA